MENERLANLTASRLKELRENRHLSHEKLSVAIKQKYGIVISKSSLVGYEAGEYSSKEGASNGMAIKYLRCLADFYGVPADYILGLGDNPAIELDEKAAFQYTGLSIDAVRYLHDYKNEHPKQIEALNEMLVSQELSEILMHLANIRILCNSALPIFHDLSNDADEAKKEKSIRKLTNSRMRIYRKRQELHGEQWGYLESARKLAEKMCGIAEVEKLAQDQLKRIADMEDEVLHEKEVKE